MIIVSMTSYPKRFDTLIEILNAVLNQTKKLDKICLTLSEEEVPEKENGIKKINIELFNFLVNNNIEILWSKKNYRSYMKLIECLKKYPDDTIITLDDDCIYPKDHIENLVNASNKYPNVIISGFIRKYYINWITKKPHSYFFTLHVLNKGEKTPSFKNYLLGISGVLYPPNSLYKNAIDYGKAIKLCEYRDDIWFWFNAIRNNTKIYSLEKKARIVRSAILNKNTNQSNALTYKKKKNGGWGFNGLNDIAIKNLYREYKEVFKKCFK